MCLCSPGSINWYQPMTMMLRSCKVNWQPGRKQWQPTSGFMTNVRLSAPAPMITEGIEYLYIFYLRLDYGKLKKILKFWESGHYYYRDWWTMEKHADNMIMDIQSCRNNATLNKCQQKTRFCKQRQLTFVNTNESWHRDNGLIQWIQVHELKYSALHKWLD